MAMTSRGIRKRAPKGVVPGGPAPQGCQGEAELHLSQGKAERGRGPVEAMGSLGLDQAPGEGGEQEPLLHVENGVPVLSGTADGGVHDTMAPHVFPHQDLLDFWAS